MSLKIGINGFGRIGRMVFRLAMQKSDVEVVAINDLLDVKHLSYLLKYDSVHGLFKEEINVENEFIVVGGKKIRITSESNPENIGWDKSNTDVVAECTGFFTSKDKAMLHISGGAKKVVISAPSQDVPMFVVGVNHMDLKASNTIVSNASCTTNCLAPIAKVLNDNFIIKQALMTTVHATTATQFTVDGPSKKDFRGGRSALLNIIPASTGAAKAVTKVIPSLVGKLTGMAFRIPTANVSVVDLTVELEKSTDYEGVKKVMKNASETSMKNVMGYEDEPVVSQDFIGDERTSIFDANAGIKLNDNFFKIISWYDNECGYSSKLISLAQLINKI